MRGNMTEKPRKTKLDAFVDEMLDQLEHDNDEVRLKGGWRVERKHYDPLEHGPVED